jgi:hypothetical protein
LPLIPLLLSGELLASRPSFSLLSVSHLHLRLRPRIQPKIVVSSSVRCNRHNCFSSQFLPPAFPLSFPLFSLPCFFSFLAAHSSFRRFPSHFERIPMRQLSILSQRGASGSHSYIAKEHNQKQHQTQHRSKQ